MKKIRDAIIKFLRKTICLIMWVIGFLMFIMKILSHNNYDFKSSLLLFGAFAAIIVGSLIGAEDFSFKETFKKISKYCKNLFLVVYIKTIQIICYIFCSFKSLKEFIIGFKDGFKNTLGIHSPSKMFMMSKKDKAEIMKEINKRDRSQIYSSRFFINIEDSDGNSYILSKNLLDCAGTYIDVIKGHDRSNLEH